MSTDLLTGAGRETVRPTVRISYDADHDFLFALQPGVVIDGHGDDETEQPLGGFFVFRRGPGGPVIGFAADEAFEWDVMSNEDDVVWNDPELRFDVPTLGLRDASVGAIVLAAQGTITGSTPDVLFFDLAVCAGSEENLEEAEHLWRLSLAAGEMKAHFGLGYTLVELGRPHEAYGHLVTYTELTPRLAWAWCWRGRAAAEMGERDEARKCFERALEATADGSEETDAEEFLAALDA